MAGLLVFIFGLMVGSFVNVMILRLKSGQKIINSRSQCPYCKQTLKAFDLIPVFSFIFQRGKCRYCQKKISWQYPLVELAIATLFLVAFVINIIKFYPNGNFQFSIFNLPVSRQNFQFFLTLIRDWIFIIFLIIIFVYDLRWYLILDRVTMPAMALAIGFNLYLGISWQSLVVAGLVGLLFFLIQFLVSKGKWIGGGDLRLGLLMGLMLGWPNVIVGIFLAYIIGAVFSIWLLTTHRKKLKSLVPFGTFLSVGTIIALFWGEKIINWYLNFL